MRAAASRTRAAPRSPALPRLRAPLVFGALALLFAGLLGRSLYLQWIDNDFLQEQGSARYSRELEVPAHRGRILDRSGEALAISTPVKSLWAFPDQFEATPDAARAARARARDDAAGARGAARRATTTSCSSRSRSRRRSPSARWRCGIKGLHDAERVPPLLPGRRSDRAHRRLHRRRATRARKASSSRSRSGSAARPGSRRVIIDRRGDIVEDVAAIRAPQAGRDLALSIDSRLQYLAFRELKAAVEQHKAKAGGLVVLDAQTGEILALANWPTYNPNRARQGRARADAQPRADRRVRAGLDAEAVHDRRGARRRHGPARHADPDRAGHADDRQPHDPRRASRRAR